MREKKIDKSDDMLCIAIYVDNMERYHFFKRIGSAVEALGHKVHYITPRLSVYMLLLAKKKKVYCLKFTTNPGYIAAEVVLKSVQVLANYHSVDLASKIYSSALQNITKIFHTHPVDLIFIWNGSSTISMALKSYANKNQIGCRFFEISNLGAKIFVDTEGVNAQSYLYKHPKVLDMLEEVSEDEWISWENAYKNDKAPPKQALLKNKISIMLAIDAIGFLFGCIREDYRNPFKVIWGKLKRKQSECFGEIVDLHQKKYCFLPLQVSNDSQLLINSDYSNEELIEIANKFSVENSYTLIVKVHPAEQNIDFISSVYKMQKSYGFTLACNDTKELIQKSEMLLVNNSTVGLEAKILDKPVKVYGRAIYDSFDSRRLRVYVLRYLIDVDYFANNETISMEDVKKIISVDEWACCEK